MKASEVNEYAVKEDIVFTAIQYKPFNRDVVRKHLGFSFRGTDWLNGDIELAGDRRIHYNDYVVFLGTNDDFWVLTPARFHGMFEGVDGVEDTSKL